MEVKDCRDCEHFYDKYPRNKGYCDLSKDRIDWCFGYDVPSDCPLEDKKEDDRDFGFFDRYKE